MKKLPLSDMHEKNGGKMVDFAGYYMPVQYIDGIKKEHQIVRNSVGVFDVSHMGEVFVSASKAQEYLQYITSNDVSQLTPGKVQYTCFPNNTGGIVDDFLLYQLAEQEYLLVLNASNIQKDIDWMHVHNTYNVSIIDRSEEYCLFALQGPDSISLLQEITDVNLSNIKYYHFEIGDIHHVKNVIISRTGYTGEIGFELYVQNKYAIDLWRKLFQTSVKLHPIGLGARDTLRLEKGFCLYGNDIDEQTSPIEAGLGWITKFSKSFINSDNLLKQKKEGVESKLVGIELLDKGIARKDYLILDHQDKVIGRVTSGTISPTLNKSISLGYILSEQASINNEIFIQIRNKKIRSKIVPLPFL